MIIKSAFKPAVGFSHFHLQTLLPTILHKKNHKKYHWQELSLPDGDFVDLCWNKQPDFNDTRPIVVVFHGLEGSINSPYAQHIMQALEEKNWNAVLMHFRGCSGRANKLARAYHSGETEDAKYLIQYLQQHYTGAPIAAVGYSLGGNMLLKLQAEYAEDSPLKAAVSVCAPIQLDKCADRIDKGFSRVYQKHLMKRLVRNVLRKYDQHDFISLADLSKDKAKSLKTFWQFDDAFTARVHGFGSAENYYKQSSARQYLQYITQPTLAIQSIDDPFMTADVIPEEKELGSGVTLEVSHYGGHVGFVSGSVFRPKYWLPERICEYLSGYLKS
ncbi:MAG: hydrolase [Gammaproteobacteria bacterium]|nr:hydrolase [Gammaproteobacteria bacterium]